MPNAQIQPINITPDYSIAVNAFMHSTGMLVLGIVLVVAVAVRNTTSKDRAEVTSWRQPRAI